MVKNSHACDGGRMVVVIGLGDGGDDRSGGSGKVVVVEGGVGMCW